MRVSVVMPAYNEEGAIERAVEEVCREVLSHVPESELIVVDDGSRDRTGEILDRLATADPRVRAVHQSNRGHGGALMTGLSQSRGDYFFLLDSDCQISLTAFPRMWDAIQGNDAVFGVRRIRHDPAFRLLLTRVVQAGVWGLFGVWLQDANVPCKLFRREVWQAASSCFPENPLAPSLFLAVFAKRRGYRVVEMEVEHRPRVTGMPSIRSWKLIKFSARGFRQLVQFRGAMRKCPIRE